MALLLRPKYLLVYKTRRGELKRIGEGGEEKKRREGEEEEEEEEEEEKRREEKKEEGRGVQGRFKGMESNIKYGILKFV